ncbi:hypothetical protein GS597_02820 [Synechococcales cyanobacterium C]|uniref:Uncharacterized protein n=1 Tax=Petrachloros mirabilis ULC683 TaxID=2781853 RepID=A0A8K1ZX24_9CYAN|nr:hypothetical protein [Petrachloros mirabilis]NCJ05462.1 hypothetical protein [Petrachloros mirabilis ULC683]
MSWHCPKVFLLASALSVLGTSGLSKLVAAQPAPISLPNVVRFYTGLPHQERAIFILQQQINQTTPELLQGDDIFANVWRDSPTLLGHVNILNQIAPGDRSGSDPLTLALSQVQRSPGTATEIELLPAPSVESPQMVMVSVTLSGLLDDSVAAQRYRFDLRRQDTTWEIVRAGRQNRCRLGRGSQTWSSTLCT